MAVNSSKPEVVTKLVRLAGGNLDLVHRAIRETMADDKPADLAAIVAFIEKHRELETGSTEDVRKAGVTDGTKN